MATAAALAAAAVEASPAAGGNGGEGVNRGGSGYGGGPRGGAGPGGGGQPFGKDSPVWDQTAFDASGQDYTQWEADRDAHAASAPTPIDPTQFASGPAVAPSVERLQPPTDIDAAGIGEYEKYEAQTGQIDEGNTVEGRMSGLLSRNSDYMKRAESRANLLANSRGILNSTMAVGAAHGAAIDAALPIAQQDSSQDLQMNLANVGYENTAAQYGAEASRERENLQAGLEQDTRQFNQTQTFQADQLNQTAQNQANSEFAAEQNRNKLRGTVG